MKNIKIMDKIIGEKVFITVDIGKNHNGSMKEAKWLVDKAKEAGVDAVKFQTHNYSDEQRKVNIISPHFKDMERYKWVKNNTMPLEWWEEISDYSKKKGLIFYSTPMSSGAVDILEKIDVPLFKIGSADVTDLFMIEKISKLRKPIIISSGMSSLEDIEIAINKIKEYHNKIIIMHCVSEYPCPPEHLNLRTIEFLREKFDSLVGLSDHVLELETSSAAVALGAVAIEKHFTRNRKQFGPDHKVSLIPSELKDLVKRIRNVEKSLGKKIKTVQEGEKKFKRVFYKSITSKKYIKKGDTIRREDIISKRPGDGLMTKEADKIIGKKTKRDIKEDELILLNDVE